MKETAEKFTCDCCHQTFLKPTSGWSDTDAMEESFHEFGPIPKENLGILCDDCYQQFMAWLKVNNVKT